MPNLDALPEWTFRHGIDRDSTAALIGYDVIATDGSVGEVTEESTKVGASYIVVDIGFWLRDKKRLIPANAIQRIDTEAETLHLTMRKQEIEDAPDYVEESAIEDDPELFDAHHIYYRPYFGI